MVAVIMAAVEEVPPGVEGGTIAVGTIMIIEDGAAGIIMAAVEEVSSGVDGGTIMIIEDGAAGIIEATMCLSTMATTGGTPINKLTFTTIDQIMKSANGVVEGAVFAAAPAEQLKLFASTLKIFLLRVPSYLHR